MLIGYVLGRQFEYWLSDIILFYRSLSLGFELYFLTIGIPGCVLLYFENKWFWSRFLRFETYFELWGVSAGLTFGLISLYVW